VNDTAGVAEFRITRAYGKRFIALFSGVTASCRPVPALVFLKTIPAKSTFASVLMPPILPFLRNDSIHRPECRAIIDLFICL